eukprot:870326-Pleurochrysis_carterae.AAC.1
MRDCKWQSALTYSPQEEVVDSARAGSHTSATRRGGGPRRAWREGRTGIDRSVVELLVHLVDGTHGPHKQCGRGHETPFHCVRDAKARGFEIETRNVSHQHGIRAF